MKIDNKLTKLYLICCIASLSIVSLASGDAAVDINPGSALQPKINLAVCADENSDVIASILRFEKHLGNDAYYNIIDLSRHKLNVQEKDTSLLYIGVFGSVENSCLATIPMLKKKFEEAYSELTSDVGLSEIFPGVKFTEEDEKPMAPTFASKFFYEDAPFYDVYIAFCANLDSSCTDKIAPEIFGLH